MKFKPMRINPSAAKRRAGFTLAEVLAALVFMAIVIPTALKGLSVANQAGQLGIRKMAAARVAERALNELLVTHQWMTAAPSGAVQDGPILYRWSMRMEPWNQLNASTAIAGVRGSANATTLRLLTVQVTFPLQGKDYSVNLSTVVDPNATQ